MVLCIFLSCNRATLVLTSRCVMSVSGLSVGGINEDSASGLDPTNSLSDIFISLSKSIIILLAGLGVLKVSRLALQELPVWLFYCLGDVSVSGSCLRERCVVISLKGLMAVSLLPLSIF